MKPSRTEKMPRYVEYVRVSTDGQKNDDTQEGQVAALARLRKSRPGTAVREDPFFDLGVSGIEIRLRDRPGWRDVQALVERGEVDEVRTYDFSRITRETGLEDLAVIHGLMRHHHIVIVDATGRVFAMRDFASMLDTTLTGLLGGWEAGRIRSRTIEGRKRTMRGGTPCGGTLPIGYRTCKQGGWELDPARADLVRKVFDMVIEGISLTNIAKRFNSEGVPPVRGSHWNHATVGLMVARRDYLGSTHRNLDGEDFHFEIPPLIDPATWEAAQASVRVRKNVRARHGTVPALCRGLVTCGACGAHLRVVGYRARPPRYYCAVCKGLPYHRADLLDIAVWGRVSTALVAENGLLVDAASADGADVPLEHDRVIAEADVVLERIARKTAGMTKRWSADLITEDDYDGALKELKGQRADAERRRAGAARAKTAMEAAGALRVGLADRLASLRERLPTADFNARREILQAVVPVECGEIRVHPDCRIEIIGVIPIGSTVAAPDTRSRIPRGVPSRRRN